MSEEEIFNTISNIRKLEKSVRNMKKVSSINKTNLKLKELYSYVEENSPDGDESYWYKKFDKKKGIRGRPSKILSILPKPPKPPISEPPHPTRPPPDIPKPNRRAPGIPVSNIKLKINGKKKVMKSGILNINT